MIKKIIDFFYEDVNPEYRRIKLWQYFKTALYLAAGAACSFSVFILFGYIYQTPPIGNVITVVILSTLLPITLHSDICENYFAIFILLSINAAVIDNINFKISRSDTLSAVVVDTYKRVHDKNKFDDHFKEFAYEKLEDGSKALSISEKCNKKEISCYINSALEEEIK